MLDKFVESIKELNAICTKHLKIKQRLSQKMMLSTSVAQLRIINVIIWKTKNGTNNKSIDIRCISEMYICKSICSSYAQSFLMSKGVRDRQRNHVYLPDRVRFMEQGCWSLGRTLWSSLEEVEPQKLQGLSPTYPDESFGAQNSFETFSRRPSFIRLNRRETPPRLVQTLKKS